MTQKDLMRFTQQLETLNDKAMPFATRNTLNRVAFKARSLAQAEIADNMVLRNKWTARSVMVDRSKSLKISQQEARTGTRLDYLRKQEQGATEVAKGKHGVAIPTSYSTGEGDNVRPRRKLPRKANKLRNIRLTGRRLRGMSRSQRTAVTIQSAIKSGRRYVYLDLFKGRRKGIFRIVGGKRNAQIKMVHDLSRKSIRIPRNPWLAPAVKSVERYIPAIYREELMQQLKRSRIFKG